MSSILSSPSPPPAEATRPWHAVTSSGVLQHFHSNSQSGLTEEDAKRRLGQYGPNQLRKEKQENIWDIFLEEVREPMILLLLVTGVLYAMWGEAIDAATIFGVILVLVLVEVLNERRAERAIAALRKLAEPTALVCRQGRWRELVVESIVPGDRLLLQAGRRVPADARLVETHSLAVDESALTGESVPVEKDAEVVLTEATLAERRNLAYAGTLSVRGRGYAVVVATGPATELGRTTALAREVKPPRTPLQLSMRSLTRRLVLVALAFSTLVPLLGWLGGQSLQDMLLTGLSLAFATIPEELPIIITTVLALGAYRLSQRQAVVKRLRAVETLGAVTVIATDKTGTLTENRMEVVRWEPEVLTERLQEIGVLCNSAPESEEAIGDPLEAALLRAAARAGRDNAALRRAHPLREEFTFDSVRKRMAVVVEQDGQWRVALKGAPESVLACASRQRTLEGERPLTEADREAVLDLAGRLAGDGLRVLAFAEKVVAEGRLSRDEAEFDLTFVGLAGLADPPRPEAKDAIIACRQAGIRPIMITGDHPLTARAIAARIGLDAEMGLRTGPELDVLSDAELEELLGKVGLFARTTAEHKLRIVQALQARGERVAVTGDGVNDTPALSAADIGVAMGQTGSDAAREAADLVLADDNFATIVCAVEQGRVVFANLQKGVRYYLACKAALISATLLPVLLRVPVPFAPIQIILMELFMDLAASAAFVAEPAESGLMRRPPRDPKVPFLNAAMLRSIGSAALGLFVSVSVAYLACWYSTADLARAQTSAFVTWLLGHVLLAFHLRSERRPLVQAGLFSNRLMVGWGAATVLFLLGAATVPAMQAALKTVPLSAGEWLLAVGAACIGTGWLEVRKWNLPADADQP